MRTASARWVAMWLMATAVATACKGSADEPRSPPSAPPEAQITPPRQPRPETVVVGAVRAAIAPRAGRWALTAVDARATFNYPGAPLAWSVCGAACVPPAETAALWTEQSQVSFADFDGTCYSNGATVACGSLPPPCEQPGMFCAPLQIVSNVSGPAGARSFLPDVIIQLSQDADDANEVIGCREDAVAGFGLCAGTGKVDAPTSNLTSPIPGGPSGTLGCSYCYGNRATAEAQGRPGLQHGVLGGADPPLRLVNTTRVAMLLENAEDHFVDITIRQAVPTYDVAAAQMELKDGAVTAACAATGQTRVFVRGGGFGPPGECLGASLGACALSGPPAPGYLMEFESATGAGYVAATSVIWSDGEVSGLLPQGGRAGAVRLTTPQAPGGLVTTAVFSQCIDVAAAPALRAGATSLATGGVDTRAKIEVGRSMRATSATGVDGGGNTITMKVDTAVRP